MNSPERKSRVQSVERAIDLLETLSRGGPLGVSELVLQTGLPLGTVHRLLSTLNARGYTQQLTDRRYAVGAAALSLTSSSQQTVADLGQPGIHQLTAAFGESANLAVLQGDAMVYVAQSPSPHSLRIFAEVGRQVPLHSTAIGKAVLSTFTDDQVVELLAKTRLTASTPYTLTRPAEILAELAVIRSRGFAIDDQEQELSVRCVAAPVATEHGRPARIAMSISGPTERFTGSDAMSAGPVVVSAASTLAGLLSS